MSIGIVLKLTLTTFGIVYFTKQLTQKIPYTQRRAYLLELYDSVTNELDKRNIPYWLTYGSF